MPRSATALRIQDSAEIAGLTDLERLDQLLERMLDVSTWDELLAALDR
jgi:hypothetical protein